MRPFWDILLWFECLRRTAAEEEAHLRSPEGRGGAAGPRPGQSSEPAPAARGSGRCSARGQRKQGRGGSEPLRAAAIP